MDFILKLKRTSASKSSCLLDTLYPEFQPSPHNLQRVACTAILFAVLVARVLFWLFLCLRKDLCRQPFGIPVEHARDENAVTMEFLGHVSVIRCCAGVCPLVSLSRTSDTSGF